MKYYYNKNHGVVSALISWWSRLVMSLRGSCLKCRKRLLRLLMPVHMFESPISIMNMVKLGGAEERQIHVQPVSKQPVEASAGVIINEDGALVDTHSIGYVALTGKFSVSYILRLIWIAVGIVVGLWFIGTNLVFNAGLRRKRRRYSAIDCRLPVYIVDNIASPCLFGALRPAIYLTMEAAENNHVITHELCHYRHGDHIWPVLRGLCLAIWWWNPLVWAADGMSRIDSELACDEAVIKEIGEEHRLAYGRTLIDMVSVKRRASDLMCAATAMNSGKRGIKERLNMIIKILKHLLPLWL